ncbi:Brp/Blh family beta-carotene 15,15'-dioxygenase [Parasphingorhabdus sp.]|uniref:Brp/Blh family beta-carotene 15,15'-dioxygenase n=1 Tax=Parasphingorhabdus sp. TaxID=2709688 RepID=UPI0035937726
MTLPRFFSGFGFGQDGDVSPATLALGFFAMFALVQDSALVPVVTLAACLSMLIIGMPHGMFDYLTLRDRSGGSIAKLGAYIAIYCSGAAVALIGWKIAPLASLAAFLILAVAHFSEDWAQDRSKLFAVAMATSVIALPALTYPSQLSAMFGLVVGKNASILTDMARLVAPLFGLISLVLVAIDFAEKQTGQALRNFLLLSSALLLPPAIGFAIFFCLFHSPRHFVEGYRELLDKKYDQGKFFTFLTWGSGAVYLCVHFVQPKAMPDQMLIATIFQTFAILTVPHLLMPLVKMPSRKHPDQLKSTAQSRH